ncbi:hypothetical protein [Archangium sp.]|uniref:hypothetical protein n=1 Tax=Archangium sp. TaxID=1872627 RepID=UPI002D6AEE48|nr:hypothetical protein [Archangium sp.]HYO54191.1 hypothetical protein [Archangium sp.]
MDYYIMARGNWALPAADMGRLLVERWPGAHVEEVENPQSVHCLEFEIPLSRTRLRGSLHRKGHAVIFFGDMPECAEFVLWFRSVVPGAVPLFLCDENVSEGIDLTAASTPEDVLRALRYSPQE